MTKKYFSCIYRKNTFQIYTGYVPLSHYVKSQMLLLNWAANVFYSYFKSFPKV